MESMINFQIDIKNRIKKSKVNFKKSPKDRICLEYIEGRLESVEQLWGEFLKGHKEIMRSFDPTNLEVTSYMKEDVYDQTEELYIEYKCELKVKAKAFTVSDNANAGKSHTHTQLSQVKLPKINITVFSGKYCEWSTFRDLFRSLIHCNESLDNVQKLHYLKGYLTDEAEQLIRHVPIQDCNYERCWKLLEERYNNRKYVSHHTIKRLLSQKNIYNESAVSLKELLDTTNDCLATLANINIDVGSWDILIIHILCLKLDPETRKQWEFYVTSNNATDKLPTYEQFREFLTNRYRALEFLDSRPNSLYRAQSSSNVPVNKFKSLHVTHDHCSFCADEHLLAFCEKFCKETVDARRNFVQNNNVCFNCLSSGHLARMCQSKSRCRICKSKHHSLLHPRGVGSVDVVGDANSNANMGTSAVASTSMVQSEDEIKPLVTCFSSGRVCKQVLLATALVKALSKNGNYYTVRALLDQGSQSSFVTESTAQYLGLKKIPVKGHITGLGGDKKLTTNSMVTIEMKSIVNPDMVYKVNAYVLKNITTELPSERVEVIQCLELTNLELADPNYYLPNKVDILLGAEVYGKVLKEGIKKSSSGALIAQATSLGWILSGVVLSSARKSADINVLHTRVHDDELLKRFWELEKDTELTKEQKYTEEEKLCEEHFDKTIQRDENGSYIARLPFKNDEIRLEGSEKICQMRLNCLQRKFDKDKTLKERYSEVFYEYLSLDHMEKITDEEKGNKKAVYLPHLCVIREDKDSSKVRVVFDASCKYANGRSLNEHLLVGPTLQPDLRNIIIRWRLYPICMSADIVKMYRQIKIHPEDADYQRVLWRDDSQSYNQHYRLTRLTFGTACAPYIAVKVLQRLATDEGTELPLVSNRLVTDFYMDDLLTGCHSEEEGLQIFKEMNSLLGKGGFELQKWASNNENLLAEMKRSNKYNNEESLKFKENDTMKVLGITWDRKDDSFRYMVNLPELRKPVTKRKIISDISRFFDPIGWASPSTVTPKIMIQRLWLEGLEWDEVVSDEILKDWMSYRKELLLLSEINIPRWAGTSSDDKQIELHGFCDASQAAYAAVVYLRVTNNEGLIKVALITAKTKVAPVKQVSIPRLELCGAVMLSRLLTEIAVTFKIPKKDIHAWTDSTVVLAWINSHPNRWKIFVANRVSEIQTNLEPNNWSHVATDKNPADSASRGLRPSELVNNTLWFNGPDFLLSEHINYKNQQRIVTEEEIKAHCGVVQGSFLERFSSLMRMIRVLTYCRQFVKRCKKETVEKYLTAKEMTETMENVIKVQQEGSYEEEIKNIKMKKNLSRNSKICSLSPFLDEDGVLRVGGRLEHSQFNKNRKHPIIIPKQCYLGDLLIADAHSQTLHGGPQLMLRYLQEKYFIIGVKQRIKTSYRKCIICAKNKAATNNQIMGQLPSVRVTPARPFKYSGVDYAGPIQIRTTKGRGHKSYKGYICLFVCMSTRAVHLEVVSDLSSEGFLQAYKRFVCRRGPCFELWSDNGTNFVGASKDLKKLFSEEQGIIKTISESLANNNCSWHFIPPHSPNFGGLWEAGVKSVKYHLRRVIGNSTLTFEEMSTVLSQIEACLNSRPLSTMGDDIENWDVITPGHFLIGEPLLTPPDRSYESSNIGSLRRWQYTQRMLQDFWRQWSKDYLMKFLQRHQWSSGRHTVNVGDIVVVKEDGLPPCRWLYGRIIAIHPGLDKVVRVVTLKTKNGELKRPVSKLCLLPVSD